MSRWLLLWVLLLSLAEAPRPFDGTYTVVNKANGHRMFASAKAGLYIVDDSGPIYSDQMWLFAPQDNESYAIINAANGLRVLAQSAADGENSFFAVDHGPIYQDQRWRLAMQVDGSYAIENVKSSRRILARVGGDGVQRFAAIADPGPVQVDETWWLINQERDETGQVLAELEFEKARMARVAEDAAVAKNASVDLLQRLQDALDTQSKLARESDGWKHESLSTSSLLQQERSSKAKLARDVEFHQSELLRLQSALTVEQAGKERLLSEVRNRRDEQLQQTLELDGVRVAQDKLAENLKASASKSAKLSSELKTVKAAKVRLLDAVSTMRNQVARLSSQFRAASDSNSELVSKVKIFEMQPECWMPTVDIDVSTQLLMTMCTIAILSVIASCGRHHVSLVSEVRGKRKRISVLEGELHAEFGNMVGVGDSDSGLGSDFGFCVFNSEINQEAVRLIKVQCPGVKHADVEIDLIFNGCEVTIKRQASRGVASANWKRRYQFKPSDGLFEFREEQMILEDGFLQLVFRACAFQNRRVLFPRHFNLTESDADTCWDFSADIEVDKGDEADAWWNEAEGPEAGLDASLEDPGKSGSLADLVWMGSTRP